MKRTNLQTAGGKIQHVLDDFFAAALKEHAKDGEVSKGTLQEVQRQVAKLENWGKLVVLAHVASQRSVPKYVYHVAAAFEFLVLCALFQDNQLAVHQTELSIQHYSKEKQPHAQESIHLVLGDASLVLLYSLLSHMPASPEIILQYKKHLSESTKEVFLQQTRKAPHDLYRNLFEQAVHLGNSKRSKTFTKHINSFLQANKKESGMKLVDSFLGMY